jgi:dihydroneopterin aldolase
MTAASGRDRISLRGMRFEGHHGVSDEERGLPQLIEVDIELQADLTAAARSDALDDTIDYGPLVEIARSTVEDERYRLLERIAGAIIERILEDAPAATGITVRVRKLAVPVDADIDDAEVTLFREREG